jgi:A/G-specific adenine glycosylase
MYFNAQNKEIGIEGFPLRDKICKSDLLELISRGLVLRKHGENGTGIRLKPNWEFRERLMGWYLRTNRALPWRKEPTPYRVWISEVMLQQTQAATVSPYYARFLERFPNLETLAKASEQEVLALWSGLGYYTRARNLHKAARRIFQFNGGVFPTDFETVFALPGVGRYTAGAICSLAFNQPQPIVDGNIRRVITRFNGIRIYAPESYFWKQMKAWIPKERASIFNQAMMELGARVCLPFRPRCIECPISSYCRALKMNLQNSLPRPRSRKPAQNVEMIILILHKRNKLLLVNKMPDFIPGQWGFPSQVIPRRGSAEENACRLSLRICCKSVPLSNYAKLTHAIGNRRIAAHVFAGEASSRIRLATEELCWIEQSRAGKMLTSSLFLKALSKTEA